MLHRMMEEGEDRGHGIDGHGRFHWIVCVAVGGGETECGVWSWPDVVSCMEP